MIHKANAREQTHSPAILPSYLSTHANIIESISIRSVLKPLSFDSWLVLDLDNTVIEPSQTVLGSDQWFCALMSYACRLDLDNNDAVSSVMAIYNEVHQHVSVQPVEQQVVKIINRLQRIGVPVLALTARGRELEAATNRQLRSIGVNLESQIIFCAGGDKGCYLREKILLHPQRPTHIVMADDKEKHLLHVKKELAGIGVEFHGIRYGHLDEKIKSINLSKANDELVDWQSRFPSEVLEHMQRLRISVSCEVIKGVGRKP